MGKFTDLLLKQAQDPSLMPYLNSIKAQITDRIKLLQ